MTEIKTEQKISITEDISRLGSVCRDLGYIGALADEYYHDSTGSDIADEITEYIIELFNVKQTVSPIIVQPPYVTYTNDPTDPTKITRVEYTNDDTLVARATTCPITESDTK